MRRKYSPDKPEKPIHERVRSALRKVDSQSKAWGAARARAVHPTKKKWFICEHCKSDTPFIKVDHIIPVGSLDKDLANLKPFCDRLFVGADARQSICDGCHSPKTRIDNAATRATRKRDKKVTEEDLDAFADKFVE